MKALYFHEHGRIENLRCGEVETPQCGSHDVLVKVAAASINHLDLWVLRGWPSLKLPKPHIGGADIAGEIVQTGSGVADWHCGQRVVVSAGFLEAGPDDQWTLAGSDSLSPRYRIFGEARRGGFAEFVAVPKQALLRLPDHVDFVDAAALPLVGTTCWRMMKHRAKLQSGETVLVVGAGGGVNSLAIQLAKLFGALVVALTSTPEKMERARSIGADEVINYRENPAWAAEVKSATGGRGADVVIDNVGRATIAQSIRAAARGGRIITVGNTSGPIIELDNRLVFSKQISLLGSTMGSRADFEAVMQQLFDGRLKPVIDRTYPLAPDGGSGAGHPAYRLLESGGQFGKVLVIP